MSVERPTPQVVAFDGLHRSGKGTQATLLHEANISSRSEKYYCVKLSLFRTPILVS